MRNALKPLYAMEVLSGISRGSYLVCIGWNTLIVGDDVARVGQAFIIAMLTNILAGPLIGVVVDRHDRRNLVVFSHLGIAFVLSLLGILWIKYGTNDLTWLFAAVVAVSALRFLHNTAHDSLIKSAAEGLELVRIVARFRTIHLLSTVVGTVLAGSVIERFSPGWGFMFSAAASVALTAPMVWVTGWRVKENAPGIAGLITDLRGGFDVFYRNRSVRLATVLAGVSLPVGQLSNAILSSFVRDDLGHGSEAFGIVDAAWPLGGMLAAAVLSLGTGKTSRRHMEYVFAVIAGLSTIGLAISTTIASLVVFHGLMGLAVWLCRIVIDTRILEACASEMVGRTKVYVDMVFSGSAIVMCFSPTVVSLPSPSSYFIFWGALITLASLALWIWSALSSR